MNNMCYTLHFIVVEFLLNKRYCFNKNDKILCRIILYMWPCGGIVRWSTFSSSILFNNIIRASSWHTYLLYNNVLRRKLQGLKIIVPCVCVLCAVCLQAQRTLIIMILHDMSWYMNRWAQWWRLNFFLEVWFGTKYIFP